MYPQQQQQQQQQLPFDPNGPMQGQLHLSLNNPPFVPQYNNTDPRIQAYLPLIAAEAAMILQQRAGEHALRMFLWNQMAQNNYQNPAFGMLVATICDYVDLLMSKRAFFDLEPAVHAAVPKVLELFAANNVRDFPALGQFVPPQMGPAVNAVLAEFDQTGQEIQMRRAGMQQQQQPQQGGYQYQTPGYGAATHQRQFGTGHPVGASNIGGGSTPFVNNSSGGRPAANPQESRMGHRFATAPSPAYQQPFTPRDPIVNEQVQTAPPAVIVVPVAPAVTIPEKWAPSKKFPYLPAFNPVTHAMTFGFDTDGAVVPKVQERQEEMDYDRHMVMGLFGNVPRRYNLDDASQTLQRIGDGLKKFNSDSEAAAAEAAKPAAEGEAPKLVTKIRTEFIAETSESSAWLNGSLDRQASAKDDKLPDVYRTYVRVADPIVTMGDETAAIKNFGMSATYLELREKINSAGDTISPLLWGEAKMKMTALINRVLRQNLGLTDSITSFVDDIQELIDFIGDTYGTTVQDAFLKNQKENIAAVFQLLPDDITLAYTEAYLAARNIEASGTALIMYVASDYTLTFLNCLSFDLELSLADEGIGAAVTQEYTPVMYELVSGLFKDMEARGDYYLRNLIRTEDGRILEATKGYIGSNGDEDFYLLTLVK